MRLAVIDVRVVTDGGCGDLDDIELVATGRALLVFGARLGGRGLLVDNPRKVVLRLVDLLAARAEVPMRGGVKLPLVTCGLVLPYALDAHREVVLDVLNEELAGGADLYGLAVDLNREGRGVREVAVFNGDCEAGGIVPAIIGGLRLESIARLILRKFRGESATSGNRDLDLGRGFVVGRGLAAHVVLSRRKAVYLGDGAYGRVLGGAVGTPFHRGVDAGNGAILLATHRLGCRLDLGDILRSAQDLVITGQPLCGQSVVASRGARKPRYARRIGTGINRTVVGNPEGEAIAVQDVLGSCVRALPKAVVDVVAHFPRHGDHAALDGEGAGLELDLVVGVGAFGLGRRDGVAALAHALARLAGDRDPLEGLAVGERAGRDLVPELGVLVAVGLLGVGGAHRHRARRDLESDLALALLARRKRCLELDDDGAHVLDHG